MPRTDISMSEVEIREFLQQPYPGVLSTIDPRGWPHSVGIYFIPRDDGLLMWVYAKSQKAKNAARDPRACVVVEHGTPYEDLKGVLVRGRIEMVDDRERLLEIGRGLYERYFLPRTGIPYEEGPSVAIEQQAAKRVGLVLPAERVASWDHAKAR